MKLGNLSVTVDATGNSVAFFVTSVPVYLTEDVVEAMRAWSHAHGNSDMRLCLHTEKKDSMQDMIILQHDTTYHRPHKEAKSETYQMIMGEMMVCTFSPDGRVQKQYMLSSPKAPVFRMKAGVWHMNVPISSEIIFRESKTGPFRKANIEYPLWAPDNEEGINYTRRIMDTLNNSSLTKNR